MHILHNQHYRKKQGKSSALFCVESSPRVISHKLPAASFGLVEVVIGVSILGVGFGLLFGIAFASLRLASDASTKIQAARLLEEGAEAARMLRDIDNGWTFITNNLSGAKCLQYVSGGYNISTAPSFSVTPQQRRLVDHLIPPAFAQALITTTFPSVDYRVTYHNTSPYQNARGGAGTDATQFNMEVVDKTAPPFVKRVLVQFDTSTLPVGAQITDVKLKITTGSIYGTPVPVLAVTKSMSTGTYFANTDFSKWELLDGPPIYKTQTLTANQENTIDLPNTAVIIGDYTRFMLRLESELDNIAPINNYSISLPASPAPFLEVSYVINTLTSVPSNCPALTPLNPNDMDIYRTIQSFPVCRDTQSGDITEVGPFGDCDESYTTVDPLLPLYDPDTKKIVIDVYWDQRGTIKRESLETYLTNR